MRLLTKVGWITCSFRLLLASTLCGQEAKLPEAPRPFSLNLQLEERYSFRRDAAANPVSLGVSYHTPLNGYRMGVSYSYTPQTNDHAILGSLSIRLLSFGRPR